MSIITPPSPSISTSAVSKKAEPDDLLMMDGLFELVDGRLVEKHMSFIGGKTATRVITILSAFVAEHRLGEIVPEVSFKCFPLKPTQVRRPDIAFISTARLVNVPDEGHVPIRPDLAIEIISPGDEAYELDYKLEDYESAGIPLVWILNPSLKTVRVIHPNKPTIKLRGEDQLSGEDILPGFTTKVTELFPAESSVKI
jgi:Uma2 family endonuclease